MSTYVIPEASGASIRPADLLKSDLFPVTDFGAGTGNSPVRNTEAFNSAIRAAAESGGTVVIPAGTFYTYTILLKSNVNLYLEEGAVIAAAKPGLPRTPGQSPASPPNQERRPGEGGNYEEPEVNPYLGIQDHGHSYFANSLVYGADLENIMIYGKGLFTGGRFDDESGILEYILQGGDPKEPESRQAKGHRGEWFGNKGLALVRCKNIVFEDFSVTIGGHFAIIAEGCENLYVNRVLVDTTRDAFDIDCCKDVTVLHTTCNSLTDDGLCLKASFGAGIFKPLENVLIEDCVVSGYDASSVYAGEYTRDKLAAQDRCGPTGRVKFGTESTCGYHLVTIRRVRFDRSRGFAMEAVDCSSLTDVIFEDCLLDNVSSSPIFIRAGDRGRFPVTGHGASENFPAREPDVRMDNRGWVLPNAPGWHCYPAARYTPHYNRTKVVTVDGHSTFEIVVPETPVACNPANYAERNGRLYLKRWQPAGDGTSDENGFPDGVGSYEPDYSAEIPARDLPLYANGVGRAELARVENVRIRNVKITNADPRYPILLMGLTDSRLKNITLENISVEYRGGLSMEHAVEQRQLNTEWKFSQFHAKEHVQNLPWLVNTFFLKNEGLLPRADWDAERGCWRDDPYNVPELPEVYPEPSNWGILPAFGLFAKHVEGLSLKNIDISCKVPDGRHVCVFDDADGVQVEGLSAQCAAGIAPIAAVTDHFRRHTNAENVPEQPYFTTTVTGLELVSPPDIRIWPADAARPGHAAAQSGADPAQAGRNGDPSGAGPAQTRRSGDLSGANPAQARRSGDLSGISAALTGSGGTQSGSTPPQIAQIHIHAPAPGTPPDSLYAYPTVPCPETGYSFAVDTDDYPLPLTVHRPFIRPVAPVSAAVGEPLAFKLSVRNPATDISDMADDGIIYNEQQRLNHSVRGAAVTLTLSCENLPEGAVFDETKKVFSWTPAPGQCGKYDIVFVVDDGMMPEKMTVRATVLPA